MAKDETKKKALSLLAAVLVLAAIIILTINLLPLLKTISDNISDDEMLAKEIREYGFKGVVIMSGLQVLQIITIVFPSAAVQILAGLTYGILSGLVISLAGYIVADTLIFILVRRLGATFDFHIAKPKWRVKLDESILKNADSYGWIAFMMYLIPGIPNGILPYIFARSDIPLHRFLLLNVIALSPSILMCSIVGERIAKGDYTTAVAVTLIQVMLAVLGYVYRDKIMGYIKWHSIGN
ncbi:TVP38/TMEM64 family protein [Youngiibacter multivorans]|uniref:TVP38/TMEM64 family membrane protein n=1 Tax=Youngiibacter multivorans TaxID=937251 RepID=A0ABS4G821_9CLOT|nr:VTT domain-containing protein [Youngiibacter multivorans]MBP1920718.1 putative membrane protein YdjX (TVP38/TMEM64 family) [Youngiibacter multivorans]